jgi:hypothetical protein
MAMREAGPALARTSDGRLARGEAGKFAVGSQSADVVSFSVFRLLARQRRVERDTAAIAVAGRAYNLSKRLVSRSMGDVDENEPDNILWQAQIAEEGGLHVHIGDETTADLPEADRILALNVG